MLCNRFKKIDPLNNIHVFTICFSVPKYLLIMVNGDKGHNFSDNFTSHYHHHHHHHHHIISNSVFHRNLELQDQSLVFVKLYVN